MKKAIKLIAGSLVIISMLIGMATLCGCGAKTVVVPDVVSMTKEEAEKTITDAGLVMKVTRERYSDTNPKGTVDKMKTPAGEELQKGDEVQVILSRGKGVLVPDVWALTGKEAENLLTVLGLNCKVVEEYSDDVEEGKIISYTDQGTTLPVGSDITLTVSLGKES